MTTTSNADNGKTVAIISYITLIGWIVALVMHGNNKTSLGAFHLRQSLGIMLAGIAVTLVRVVFMFIPFIGGIIGTILSLTILVMWILGLVAAAQGEQKPIPVIGDFFQKTFANFAR